jgi:hypothetical protein
MATEAGKKETDADTCNYKENMNEATTDGPDIATEATQTRHN